MDIFEEIKSQVGVRELLESYGVYPSRRRNIYRCVAHQPDRKPSANISKDNRKFVCFACGFRGDIFDLVQHFDGCDRKTAMRTIDAKFKLGLYHELSHKEKLEIARKQREREKILRENAWWEEFERQTLDKITKRLREWELVQKHSHLTRGEKKRGEWEFADLFFTALKHQDWLNWLYNAICGFDHPECEYDFTIGRDKKFILEKIRKGEIEVW